MTSKCMMMSRRDGDRAVPVPLILPLSPLPQHLQHVSANIIKHVIQRNSFLEKLSIQKHIFFKLRGQFRVIWTEMNVFIFRVRRWFFPYLFAVLGEAGWRVSSSWIPLSLALDTWLASALLPLERERIEFPLSRDLHREKENSVQHQIFTCSL